MNEEDFLKSKEKEIDAITQTSPNIIDRHSDIVEEFSQNLDNLIQLTKNSCDEYKTKATEKVARIVSKMEEICIAPGEHGSFVNWGEDLFIEEKCFPEKFPFGIGGYLSTVLDDDDNSMGFAEYCKSQIMSCDPKFRNDTSYLFFLLLVKELIQLKRCKMTYLRQARRLPNMSKQDILNIDYENLTRYNRSYEVFKTVRGTSMYYEQSKKNLMAMLRQLGCPTLFLTLSCAEYEWLTLLKEIVETVERRKVSQDYIENLPAKEKNRLISENVVITTLHFQKRIDKLFALMKHDFFVGTYKNLSCFYLLLQGGVSAAGLPAYALVWLKDQYDKDTPNLWVNCDDKEEVNINESEIQRRLNKVEEFADQIVSTSSLSLIHI